MALMRRPCFPAALLRMPLLASAVLFCSAASAQSMAGMNMTDMQPVPPPDQLPVPIKMTGIGNSHITIKATPEAQAWFDQGLSLLHDFWDYESAKAFEQAIRVDPNCAMCEWGLAQALEMRGDDAVKPYTRRALDEAERLKSHASATDKLYIDAANADFAPSERGKSPAIPILGKLVKKSPHDIQARIFLAEAVGEGFDENGEPKAGQKERIAILEQILREAPNDSAANHYWIHAIEPSNHPERAIPSSALLASLAPTSGHMVHMPGHIYYRVGNYASADRWFTASMEADERYLREQHVSVDDDWNYVHNMMYAIANLMEQGRLADANALSDHLAAARGELSATLYVWSARDQMSRVSRRLPVALRTGDWSAVLAMVDDVNLPDANNTANLRFLKEELRSFAIGMQAAEDGDLVTAQAASAQMDAGLWRQGQDADPQAKTDAAAAAATKNDKPTAPVNPDAVAEPLVRTLTVASLELRGNIALAEGNLEAGKKLYTRAIADEKKLGYHEPPMYIRPVAETEGEALLRAKEYVGAKAAYQKALEERPQSGWELYGIARADELAGNTAAAQTEYEAFLKAWPSADAGLPEMERAKAAVDSARIVASE